MLAACAPSLALGHAGAIDITRLASHPLLLLDHGYSIRRLFDAACRLADVEPDIRLESRAPHTLLALAEARQGVAIIPSLLRTNRYALRIMRVTHQRKPVCASGSPFNGTGGVRCRPMPRAFATRSPSICASSSRSRIRLRAGKLPRGNNLLLIRRAGSDRASGLSGWGQTRSYLLNVRVALEGGLPDLRATPSANPSRTPPLRPRASVRSRESACGLSP